MVQAMRLLFLSTVTAILIFSTFSTALPSTSTSATSNQGSDESDDHDNLIYEHMSGIAPYHDAPGANIQPPKGCKIEAATFLFRHSSIYANDDEWEDFMKPFVEKVSTFISNNGQFSTGPLEFLNDWKSPINEENLEKLTPLGAKDSTIMGKRLRQLYPQLFPPLNLGKNGRKDRVKTPFKVWTASSSRDINTAKAFVNGAFPKHHRGKEGEGDGKYVELVEVNNKDESWSSSLTPHKICDAFSKEPGKPDSAEWLSHYGKEPLSRLQSLSPPAFDFELNDIVAMQMLCGYESVINGIGKSEFCRKGLFRINEFKDFGYWNDLLYNKMVGYEAKVSPFLGLPWLNTSLHNLLSVGTGHHKVPKHDDGDGNQNGLWNVFGKKDPDLPDSDGPPNSTHTQKLFAYFTHREEPPVALVALGLWNQTAIGPLPTFSRSEGRVWKTSHVLPFLGHVALERINCQLESEFAINQTILNSQTSSVINPLNFFKNLFNNNLWNSFKFSLSNSFSINSFTRSSSVYQENDKQSVSQSQSKLQSKHKHSDFVRVVVNGAVQPLPECNSGPGNSCPLLEFKDFVQSRAEQYGDFESACKVQD